jgi:hypothetical protein
MTLSNTELRYYDSNVLRLPADKRKGYHEQVDRLIAELCGVWKIKKIKIKDYGTLLTSWTKCFQPILPLRVCPRTQSTTSLA